MRETWELPNFWLLDEKFVLFHALEEKTEGKGVFWPLCVLPTEGPGPFIFFCSVVVFFLL